MTHLGIGIIGTGWGARVQVPAFRSVGLEIVALAGSQAAKTARIAGDLAVPWHTAEWRELIERPDVALVSIVTPPSLHRAMAVAALEAGKHVLCQKPTAMDAFEAEVMLGAANAHPDQLALIDHELRFLPTLRLAKQLIAEGAIGEPRHAELRSVNNSRASLERPWSWWSDASRGGGVLGAIGSHQIDQLRYLLGDEVEAASGVLHSYVARRHDEHGEQHVVTADDFASATLRFTRGLAATLVASTVAPQSEPNSTVIYGSAGSLRFSGGRLWHTQASGEPVDITPEHHMEFPTGIEGDFPQGTVYFGAALRAALEGNFEAVSPAATFGDGLAVQQALDMIRAARI